MAVAVSIIRAIPDSDKSFPVRLSSSPETLARQKPPSPSPSLSRELAERRRRRASPDPAATATASTRRRVGSDRRRPLLLSVPLDHARRPYNELHDLASSSRTPVIAAPIRHRRPSPSSLSHNYGFTVSCRTSPHSPLCVFVAVARRIGDARTCRRGPRRRRPSDDQMVTGKGPSGSPRSVDLAYPLHLLDCAPIRRSRSTPEHLAAGELVALCSGHPSRSGHHHSTRPSSSSRMSLAAPLPVPCAYFPTTAEAAPPRLSSPEPAPALLRPASDVARPGPTAQPLTTGPTGPIDPVNADWAGPV
jgi:hypothetical protein